MTRTQKLGLGALLLIGTAAVVTTAVVTTQHTPETLDPLVMHWRAADWGPSTNIPGFPAGRRNAQIATDPQTGGPTYLSRFPAGSEFAMHWHTYTETLVVLEGSIDVTLDGMLYTADAGSYIILPAKMHHGYKVPSNADVVLLARRDGPADYFFVEPSIQDLTYQP